MLHYFQPNGAVKFLVSTSVPRKLKDLTRISSKSSELSSSIVSKFDNILEIINELSTATENQHTISQENLARLANDIDHKTVEYNELKKRIRVQR